MPATRILIVDDEAAIRGLLKCVIGRPGIDCVEADSAERALDFAHQNPPFDLVITDVSMPGTNGIHMARLLRAGGHAVKFLFLSGCCDMQLLAECAGELDARFLSKPFGIPELLGAVRVLLEAGQRMARPPRRRLPRRTG